MQVMINFCCRSVVIAMQVISFFLFDLTANKKSVNVPFVLNEHADKQRADDVWGRV